MTKTKRSGARTESEPEKRVVAVLFSDVKGYSKLTEQQLRKFFEIVPPRISNILAQYRNSIVELNTWGDAIFLVGKDTQSIAHFALDLRDLYLNTQWAEHYLPDDLNCRIGLHSGIVYIGEDHLRNCQGVIGTQINLAARIEPITPVGQAFATVEFVDLFRQHNDVKIAFDDVGDQFLAKAFGTRNLFRMRRAHEEKKPLPPMDEGRALESEHIRSELGLLLKQRTDELFTLRSRFKQTSGMLRNASTLMRKVVCYNQGKFAQYHFLGGELHKAVRESLQTRPLDHAILQARCDSLESFLGRNLEAAAQCNFGFINEYFDGRHEIAPRVCIKANFTKDDKPYVVQVVRSGKVNYLSEYPLEENSGFRFVKRRGTYFLCSNIPQRVASGEYENERIDVTLAREYSREKAGEIFTPAGNGFQWDEEWTRCWKKTKHEDGSVDEIDPTSCYKSTLIIPMTLWNNELEDVYLDKINIKAKKEVSRTIFGYLCFDHVQEKYFNADTDIDVGYVFADLLSLYIIAQSSYTEFSETFREARKVGCE